jgi:ubiquinone/menaquinone biosynthesis C-methylase UbiE
MTNLDDKSEKSATAQAGSRMQAVSVSSDYVHESRFGFWFLGTRTWEMRVVEVALEDLQRLIDSPRPAYPVILDAGCGQGKAFHALAERFHPQRIIGVDVGEASLDAADREAECHDIRVELLDSDLAAMDLPDASVDMVFCHQTLHHLVRQEDTLAEFHRVLKPGGLLLVAESTREYICSWVIRLLFRHPMHVQKTAEGYLQLIGRAGFDFAPRNVSYPYLWWSRARDFGLLERLHIKSPPPPGKRKETLVNVVAVKRV